VRNAAVEHCLDNLVATPHDLADDDAVRLRIQLRRIKAFVNLDAELAKLGAHWWIHRGIAPGNAETGRTGERGYTAHECSADSKYVYVHRRIRTLA
jgi:hypothetical protein